MSKNLIACLMLSVVGFSAHASSVKMCGQVVMRMYNPETKEIKMASNTCVAADLKIAGFTAVTMDFDPSKEPVKATQPVSKAPQLLSVIKSGQYKIADRPLAVPCAADEACIPQSHAIMAQSKLILSLPLVGCLDTAFVTYKISDDTNGVKTVLVSALNVRNEKSDSARCIAAPVAMKTIDLQASVMDKSLLKVEFVQDIAQ